MWGLRKIMLTVGVGLLLAGCSNSECLENHSALPLASFYDSESQRAIAISNLSIYGIGAPGDSLLYAPQNLQEAYLPFRLWENSTTYVFAYLSLLPEIEEGETYDGEIPSDTVTFHYRAKEWFVSPACGAMYFYEMESVDHTSLLIDSIAFNDVITNENVSNIKIFFRNLTNTYEE